MMKALNEKSGFSLIEVNMAVFVMAVGVLSMVVLFPLGLRESTQGQADLKQSMVADYLLNQAVALASRNDVTWGQWQSVPKPNGTAIDLDNSLPAFIANDLKEPDWTEAPTFGNDRCRVACCLVRGASDRIMGIMVQSTDLTYIDNFNQYSNNPIFYAEVMFQGTP